MDLVRPDDHGMGLAREVSQKTGKASHFLRCLERMRWSMKIVGRELFSAQVVLITAAGS